MEAFWKAVAVIILTIVLGVAIGKTEKDISIVLSAVASCIVMIVAMHYLSDVAAFLWKLANNADGQTDLLDTLLKISGVALVTELTGQISSDAGNQSLGKAMQILGNVVILVLALPLFETFFSIIHEIMGFL